jgi:hypothetical protein
MKRILFGAVVGLSVSVAGAAFAASEYNAVPAGDAQYAACIKYALSKYEGGNERSKIAGQTKAQAWCTCMWNETPDDFSGSLVKFAESSKGAAMNAQCERYSGWK